MPARTCPNGSEPFPGAVAVAYFEAADIGVIAGLIGSPVLSAILFPFIEVAFDVATICASDPSDPPVFSAGDFLNPEVLLTKAKALIQSYMWNVWCKCKGSAVPSPSDWDTFEFIWQTFADLEIGSAFWPQVHIAQRQFFFDPGLPYPSQGYNTTLYATLFSGLADVTPYLNNGKPTSQTALSPIRLGYYTEAWGTDPLHDGYDPSKAGHWYVFDHEGGTLLLDVGPTEVLGAFLLGDGDPGNPTPPSIPSDVTFPADVTASLQDLQNRIKAIESKLDNLMMAITVDVGDPLQTITAPLPQLLPALIQAISPKQFDHYEETDLGEITGTGLTFVPYDGFAIVLTTIPSWAGKRPANWPLYEVNTRSLQLGWYAWKEAAGHTGFFWRTIDMVASTHIAGPGGIAVFEYSLADGVVAELYGITRVNATYGP